MLNWRKIKEDKISNVRFAGDMKEVIFAGLAS